MWRLSLFETLVVFAVWSSVVRWCRPYDPWWLCGSVMDRRFSRAGVPLVSLSLVGDGGAWFGRFRHVESSR